MASLRKLSVADLRRELDRREKGGDKLRAQHSKLAARLAEIEAELLDLGVDLPARSGRKPGRMLGRRGPGRPKGAGAASGSRAKNSMSLLEAIVSGVRVGSTVSPAEAAEAAAKAGYKSSSPNLGMMVANQLARASMFKRVGRGQYLHKGGGAAKAAKGGRPAKKAGRKPGRPKGSKNKPKSALAKSEAAA
jgi:hypothetical protein